jgi:hypothetical protein
MTGQAHLVELSFAWADTGVRAQKQMEDFAPQD